MYQEPMKALGHTGVYQRPYTTEVITTRIFECPEMLNPSVSADDDSTSWVAFITYKNKATGQITRKDTDVLTKTQLEYCRNEAAKADPTYGELYLAEMAKAYWDIVA